MQINFSDEPIKVLNKSIFLAGPTLRGETYDKSWRKEACNILEELGFDGLVYVPEFKSGNMKPDLTEQADWERDGLMNASFIIFYIPRKLPERDGLMNASFIIFYIPRKLPELPGFTTNIELGMYMVKKPEACILCIPPEAEKVSYIKWLWGKEGHDTIHETLEDALRYVVNRLEE